MTQRDFGAVVEHLAGLPEHVQNAIGELIDHCAAGRLRGISVDHNIRTLSVQPSDQRVLRALDGRRSITFRCEWES